MWPNFEWLPFNDVFLGENALARKANDFRVHSYGTLLLWRNKSLLYAREFASQRRRSGELNTKYVYDRCSEPDEEQVFAPKFNYAT
jgi:hypothetical protein